MNENIHIYEEATNLFWALVILVSTTMATYLLANTFISGNWSMTSLNQILALLLITLSFVGILKISEPLYHFTFTIQNHELHIQSKKGEQDIRTDSVPLHTIDTLKFAPYLPRSKGEALFDFSTNYQLMIKQTSEADYKPLIDIPDSTFTLKVDDIIKVIRFIKKHQPSVNVPREQAEYFNV